MNSDHYHQALGRGSPQSWSADAGHEVNLEVPHHWPRSWSPPPGPRLPSFKSSSTPEHCLLRLQTPSRAITTHSLWPAQETEEFASHLGELQRSHRIQCVEGGVIPRGRHTAIFRGASVTHPGEGCHAPVETGREDSRAGISALGSQSTAPAQTKLHHYTCD